MEKNPWWQNLQPAGPLPVWEGRPVGVKADGGGSVRGQGRIGGMRLHRAVCNRDAERECSRAGGGRLYLDRGLTTQPARLPS